MTSSVVPCLAGTALRPLDGIVVVVVPWVTYRKTSRSCRRRLNSYCSEPTETMERLYCLHPSHCFNKKTLYAMREPRGSDHQMNKAIAHCAPTLHVQLQHIPCEAVVQE
jgi:hypothetical protein